MITYDPLWETLKRKNITIYKFIHTYGVGGGTLSALKQNKSITMATLNHLCDILECGPQDIIKYDPTSKEGSVITAQDSSE